MIPAIPVLGILSKIKKKNVFKRCCKKHELLVSDFECTAVNIEGKKYRFRIDNGNSIVKHLTEKDAIGSIPNKNCKCLWVKFNNHDELCYVADEIREVRHVKC